MPTCSGCGNENPRDAAYCVQCGAQLTVLIDRAEADKATAERDQATRTSVVLLESLRDATLGEYEILGELGRGGMAVVYLAHDLALDRRVAIKVISPSVLWMGEGIAERFKREARTAASLSHPNIIPIYAVKESADLLFFVMKCVKGRALESVIGEIGRLPVAMVHTILGQVGNALGYAHRQGVVHRDVKPGNVMLDEEGWAVVTDFGIAKVAEAQGLTQTGGTVGTPSYMSPEQCSGLPVTGASDQYSLGIVAYEMLTGEKPFEAKSAMALMYKHCNTPPPPLVGAVADSPSLGTAVMRMLAKDPQDRWATLEEMVAALGAVPPAESDRVRTQMLTLARSTEAQALVEKFQTPPSPVPRDRLSDSIALATRSREARDAGAATPADVTPIPSLATGGKRKLIWAVPPALAAGLVLFLWAPWQGSDGSPTTSDAPAQSAPPQVAETAPAALPMTVEVTPPVSSLTIGDTIRLGAAVQDGAGNVLSDADVRWEASDMSVARVSSRGLVSAMAAGETEIVVRSGDATASALITVTTPQPSRTEPPPPSAPRVASVRVNPPSATLALGETAQLSAIVRDQNGNAMSRGVTWTSSDAGVAVVTAQGMVVARGEGSARITAQASGRSGIATVTVAPVAVAAVAVSPTRSSVQVGGTVQLQATPQDAGGSALQGRSVTWSSNDASVARVASSGLVTAVAPGTTTVTARSGSAQAAAQITVEPPPPAPPVAPADPTPAIRSVLEEYGQALQAGDLTALRRLWPGLPDRRAQDLQTFFDNTGDRRVRLTVEDIVPSGDAARAAISIRFEFNGGRQNHEENATVALARSGQGWYITGVR